MHALRYDYTVRGASPVLLDVEEFEDVRTYRDFLQELRDRAEDRAVLYVEPNREDAEALWAEIQRARGVVNGG